MSGVFLKGPPSQKVRQLSSDKQRFLLLAAELVRQDQGRHCHLGVQIVLIHVFSRPVPLSLTPPKGVLTEKIL